MKSHKTKISSEDEIVSFSKKAFIIEEFSLGYKFLTGIW